MSMQVVESIQNRKDQWSAKEAQEHFEGRAMQGGRTPRGAHILCVSLLTCSFHLGGLFRMMTIFSDSSFFRNFSKIACRTRGNE